jgi:2-polyprenyl-3-methyl-5-hydroxy-6-metoxy-1,4-benzoquinol methylase
VKDVNMRKPFWYGPSVQNYLTSFQSLATFLQTLGIRPPGNLLEFGCGSGWMGEFLSQMNFNVVGTTISQHEVDDANLRVEGLRAKRLKPTLKFVATPMEDAYAATKSDGPFDAVYVFEALHHAYDWSRACESAYKSLKPGCWFLLCSEPNVLHTFIAYRIARLSNTHEIGFRRSKLVRGLRKAGFGEIRILKNRVGFLVKTHWLAAQKPLS